MKKFLFTLAALFMVGTAVADDYWYVQDFEVTQAQLGTSIKVNVRAHFDYAVAAGEVNFTIPEGMTLQRIQKGTDFNIMVHDGTGAEWEAENVVFVQQVATQNCGWAFADEDYYQDASGNWVLYGSPKFLPGEYENQFILTIKVDAGFTGGNLVVESKPSCTYDLRPDVQVCPEGQDIFKTCVITVEGATPTLQDLTGNIVFGEVDQTDGSFDVTYDGPEEGVAVTVISMEPKRGQYNLPDYGTYTVTAKATKDGYNDLEKSADLTWNAPTPQTAQPNVTYEETEDGYLVTVTGNGTLTLVVDEEEVELDENNQYLIPYTNTPEGEEHTVVATAQAPGELVSDPKVVDIQDPGQTPKPTVTYTETEDGYLVSVTGYGDLTLVVDEEEVELNENNQYLIPYTNTPEGEEHTVVATAQDEGQRVSEPVVVDVQDPGQTPKPTIVYNETTHTVTVTGYGALNVQIEGYGEGDVITLTGTDQVVYTFELLDDDYEVTVSATAQDEGQRVSDYANKDFVVPAKEPVTPTEVGEPLFQGYSQDGITGYGVNIAPTTAGSEIKYRVYVEENGEWVPLTDWLDYEGTENEIWYTEEGKYRVEAYAYIGENKSETVSHEFVVVPATPTSIDEMNAGKSIAGVRYFNMAGQEMQEANGVTIVVTTYTDGTTSAVKVMK